MSTAVSSSSNIHNDQQQSTASSSSPSSSSSLLAPPPASKQTLKRKPSATRISVPLKPSVAAVATSTAVEEAQQDIANICVAGKQSPEFSRMAAEGQEPLQATTTLGGSESSASTTTHTTSNVGSFSDDAPSDDVAATPAVPAVKEATSAAAAASKQKQQQDFQPASSSSQSWADMVESDMAEEQLLAARAANSQTQAAPTGPRKPNAVVASQSAQQPKLSKAQLKAQRKAQQQQQAQATTSAAAPPATTMTTKLNGQLGKLQGVAPAGEAQRSARGGGAGGKARGGAVASASSHAASSANAITLKGAAAAAKKARGSGQVRGTLGWSDDDDESTAGELASKRGAKNARQAQPAVKVAPFKAWDGPAPPTAPRAMREKAAAEAAAGGKPVKSAAPTSAPPAAATTSSAPADASLNKWSHDGFEALQASKTSTPAAAVARGGAKAPRGAQRSRLIAVAGDRTFVGSPLARDITPASASHESTGNEASPHVGARESAAAIVAESGAKAPPKVNLPGIKSTASEAVATEPTSTATPPPPAVALAPIAAVAPPLPGGMPYPALPPGFAVDAAGVIYDLTRGTPIAVGMMPQASPVPFAPVGLPSPHVLQQHQQGGTTYFAPAPGMATAPVQLAQFQDAAARLSAAATASNRPGHTRTSSSIPSSAAKAAAFKPSGSPAPSFVGSSDDAAATALQQQQEQHYEQLRHAWQEAAAWQQDAHPTYAATSGGSGAYASGIVAPSSPFESPYYATGSGNASPYEFEAAEYHYASQAAAHHHHQQQQAAHEQHLQQQHHHLQQQHHQQQQQPTYAYSPQQQYY